jgi:hypothetical protein
MCRSILRGRRLCRCCELYKFRVRMESVALVKQLLMTRIKASQEEIHTTVCDVMPHSSSPNYLAGPALLINSYGLETKAKLITCESHTTFLVSRSMRGGLACLTGPNLRDSLTLPIIPRYRSANIARRYTYNRLLPIAGCPASVYTMPSATCMPLSPTHRARGGAQ